MFADLILTNGRFYTLDSNHPYTTTVAIKNGRFVALGAGEEMRSWKGNKTKVVDLDGRCVTPGLVDAHVHFQWYSLGLKQVDLDGLPSLDETLKKVALQMAVDGSSTQWLRGRGWSQGDWPNGTFPTAQQLDTVVHHRPALLLAKSGHAAWANSKAMQLAGITADTPDPAGGKIQRDAHGNPTGIFFETAIDLISNHLPAPTEEEVVAAMRHAQTICWQAGLVGLHDFDGRLSFQALQTLHANRELGMRILKNIPVYRLEHAIGVGLRSGFGDDWLRIGGVKIFADGALGAKTAAMIAPYENEPDNYGIVVTEKEEMMEKATQASANGLSVTVHAIGDRANHDVLDVYEVLRQQEKERASQPLRHRIEHVQLLHPDDLHRLAQLNVIASMQPTHAISDIDIANEFWGERTQYSYAWRTMLDTGAILAFGSDAPIEKIEPLAGLRAAVTRRRPHYYPSKEGWHPEQKLTMEEAVHAFTMGAALTSGQETSQGSISLGKCADMTIYSQNIFSIPEDELLDVTIAGTIVNGDLKYRTF